MENIFETAVKENVVKNIAMMAICFLFYSNIHSGFVSIDVSKIGNFFLIINILPVTLCFANFSFPYEYPNLHKLGIRLLSHSSIFIFMLLIAFLLEALVIGGGIVYPALVGITLVFPALLGKTAMGPKQLS